MITFQDRRFLCVAFFFVLIIFHRIIMSCILKIVKHIIYSSLFTYRLVTWQISLIRFIMNPCKFMWGNPPSTTLTKMFWFDLSLYPSWILFWTNLTIVISHFSSPGQHNKEKCAAPIIAIYYPTNKPPHHHSPPYHLQLIPFQDKIHAALLHSVSLHAAGGVFPLWCTKFFSLQSSCSYVAIGDMRPSHSNCFIR